MQEPKLTLEQQKKIDEIKQEWMAEVDNLTEFVPNATFDSSRSIELYRIEQKYRKRIQEIYEGKK